MSTEVDKVIAKMAVDYVTKRRISSASIDRTKDVIANNSYSAGAKDIVKEHLGGFAEWAADNDWIYTSNKEWIDAFRNRDNTTTDQLIEKYFEHLLKNMK